MVLSITEALEKVGSVRLACEIVGAQEKGNDPGTLEKEALASGNAKPSISTCDPK